MKHQQSSCFFEVGAYRLHLRRLLPLQGHGTPVLMLHGAIENGRIFYSQSGKGLGCYLADQGFEVYCADFAGRGQSVPTVAMGFDQSQHQIICQDIPALIAQLYEKYQQKIHIICHSWGGVVLLASLARFAQVRQQVQSAVYFGTKRRITVSSLQKRLQIDWFWNRVAPWLCQRFGYLPAKKLRLGADNEPATFLQDTVQWIRPSAFVDLTDQFDYGAAAAEVTAQKQWPATWFFGAINDRVLGHPSDIALFMQESHQHHARFSLLGREHGHLHDYDHITMLTHPKAVLDHFPELVTWLHQR